MFLAAVPALVIGALLSAAAIIGVLYVWMNHQEAARTFSTNLPCRAETELPRWRFIWPVRLSSIISKL